MRLGKRGFYLPSKPTHFPAVTAPQPIRRNVSPPTERPENAEWLKKVPKVEREKSTGRKKRYRRVNAEDWENSGVDGGEKRTPSRRNVPKGTDSGRKIHYMLAGAALVVIGYLLARM